MVDTAEVDEMPFSEQELLRVGPGLWSLTCCSDGAQLVSLLSIVLTLPGSLRSTA